MPSQEKKPDSIDRRVRSSGEVNQLLCTSISVVNHEHLGSLSGENFDDLFDRGTG